MLEVPTLMDRATGRPREARRKRDSSLQSVRTTESNEEDTDMRALWWRLAVGSVVTIILFGVASLKIGTHQAHVSQESAVTTTLGAEPERSWEASGGMR
jgi:hypothetical protein